MLLQVEAFESQAELVLGDVIVRGGGGDFFEFGAGAGVGLLFKINAAEVAAGERVVRVLREDLAEDGCGFFEASAVEGDLGVLVLLEFGEAVFGVGEGGVGGLRAWRDVA